MSRVEGEAFGARHETRRTRNPGGAFFDRNPTVRRVIRPAAVFVMAPPRARRVLGTLRARGRRRLLSRLVCASSSRAGPAIRKRRHFPGRETSVPPRRLPPSRRPTRSASATRPPLERSETPRDERPVRPSSLLDLTLAQRVAVQTPHPRRPASHDGEGPPTAGPPLGSAPQALIRTIPAGAPSRSPRQRSCAAPASARRSPRSPIGPQVRGHGGAGDVGGRRTKSLSPAGL